jgi:hypothetical protein
MSMRQSPRQKSRRASRLPAGLEKLEDNITRSGKNAPPGPGLRENQATPISIGCLQGILGLGAKKVPRKYADLEKVSREMPMVTIASGSLERHF